ncbi:hypothetical protein GGX14DRAFT_667895 [Mycena pura]|uniref:DUF6535 domain-containing protein n=1 Tax=Mycena pura TaxID=153505 RepID=A0AAD6Y750_9AGAR|nr:hypothetical protein GGX14DRAFT_667895 [Mycena pura]
MADPEKGKSGLGVRVAENGHALDDDLSEEAVASKLWSVYVSEAEKYDKSLVESWKGDMEGMLIFAGLFSASLTAFIMESYKTLAPDAGESTVQLLTQISQQLSAATDGTALPPLAPKSPFTPPATSLICNALWFISLGLSLSCALIATLLEQWAREFLHRADMHSSPIIRARIFSFLYYGLKRFSMHTVVDIIPLLLHMSLLFFFAGLVAFLLPINTAMAGLAASMLTILLSVYSLLTILPILRLDCPYRTPLSSTCWRVSQYLPMLWRRRHKSPEEIQEQDLKSSTIVDAMAQQAMEKSPARSVRDTRALIWTIKSLADDAELEPLLEAIPDVLWGPNQRRFIYSADIQRLLDTPGLKVHTRIEGVLRNCDSGLLSVEGSRRRRILCLKAMWAIASLRFTLESTDPTSTVSNFSWRPTTLSITRAEHEMRHYLISVRALLQRSTLFNVNLDLKLLQANVNAGRFPDVIVQLQDSKSLVRTGIPMITTTWERERRDRKEGIGMSFSLTTWKNCEILWQPLADSADDAEQFDQAAQNLHAVLSHLILFDYLELSAVYLDSPPYRWDNTLQMITPTHPAPFSALKECLEKALEAVLHSRRDEFDPAKLAWSDIIMRKLCSFWRPHEPMRIPSAIIHYLNASKDDEAFRAINNFHEHDLSHYLWFSFPITLASGSSGQEVTLDQIMTLIWRTAKLPAEWGSPVFRHQSIVAAIANAESSPMSFSTIAMVKSGVLNHLLYPHEPRILLREHELLPTETAVINPSELLDASDSDIFRHEHFQYVFNRISEAKLVLLAEFLVGCTPDFLPYRAEETLHHISSLAPRGPIHRRHQIRLAEGMRNLWTSARVEHHLAKLLEALVHCQIFDVYAERPDRGSCYGSPRHAWLEDPAARENIMGTLAEYTNLNSLCLGLDLIDAATAIMRNLQSLHPPEREFPSSLFTPG